MRFVKTFILAGLFASPLIAFSQNLKFYREDLTFEIKDGFFYVDGIYNFCNNGEQGIQQTLFYPFPIDSLYGGVDSMRAVDVNKRAADVITNKTATGLFFKVELGTYGIGKYKISYRQKLLKNKAEYILVTTQKWGAPFDNALYRLITPGRMKITSFSYTPDETKQVKSKMIYSWSKKNFMPDKNMVFYFK